MDQTTTRQHIVASIQKYLPEAKILLFGSRARGDYTEQSDYDIAIISKHATNKKELHTKISKEIHQHINAPFDILLYTPEEYEKGKKGFLPELIEQEGIHITT